MSYLSRIHEACTSTALDPDELAFYARHILLPGVGYDGQRKLKAARVAVIGAGGLGCPVLQGLVGAGVGRLTIVDGDTVAVSNISRQWLHSYGDSGRNKAESAAESVQSLNPFIEVSHLPTMLDLRNAHSVIESCDLVIDATDDLDVRYLIDDVCGELDRPWIHAALYRESAQMTVFWQRCGSTFRSLYPEKSSAPSCAGAGMLGASASVVANLQALEAIKLITGNGEPKIGELASVNTADLSMQSFRLKDVIAPRPIFCDRKEKTLERAMNASELKQAVSIHALVTIVDLRKSAVPLLANSIVMSEADVIENGIPESVEGKVVLVCDEGLISEVLAEALASFDDRVFHLEGGAKAFKDESA